MKKFIILSVLLLTSLQLNGAFSRLGQAGRQFAPTLRSQLSAQPMRLPATLPGTCPAGMRLLSSSSRSQGGYSSGAQQQAAFGGREALLLGGALVGKTVYDYLDTPESHALKRAYAAENNRDNNSIQNNPELVNFFANPSKFVTTRFHDLMHLMKVHPEARPAMIDEISKNIVEIASFDRPNDNILIIARKFPESRLPIINALANNFVQLFPGMGHYHLMQILYDFPEDAEQPFLEAAANNYITSIRSLHKYDDKEFLEKLDQFIKQDQSARQQAIKSVVAAIPMIVENEDLTLNIFRKFPEVQQEIVNNILENIPNTLYGFKLVGFYLELFGILNEYTQHPELTNPIIDFVINEIIPDQENFGSPISLDFVKTIQDKYPASRARVLEAINNSEKARKYFERRAEEQRANEARKLEKIQKKEAQEKAREEYFQRLVEA